MLRMFLLQMLAWAGLCFLVELFDGSVLHWGFPYDYPFVPRVYRFGDFWLYVEKFRFFHSRAFFRNPPLTYPAPAVACYRLFLPGMNNDVRLATFSFVAFIVAASFVLAVLFYLGLVRSGLRRWSSLLFVAGLWLLGYPLWFEVHQANMEVMVWIVLTMGLVAHWRGMSWTAAACFGAALAMKLFPFVFLGLLLARRQWRQIGFALVVAVAVTLVSAWLLCPDIPYSLHATGSAMSALRDGFLKRVSTNAGMDHGLFTLIKLLLPTLPSKAAYGRLLLVYLAGGSVTGTVLYFVRIRRLPVLNQIVCLSVVCILLPPVTYDYTLVHLYVPFALLVLVWLRQGRQTTRFYAWVFGLFAFLLSWQSEFIVHGERLGAQCKCLALVAVFVLFLRYPVLTAGEHHPDEGAAERWETKGVRS